MRHISDGPDLVTHNGAIALAERIQKFWGDKGLPVSTVVQPTYGQSGVSTGLHEVRSNMKNGYPAGVKV